MQRSLHYLFMIFLFCGQLENLTHANELEKVVLFLGDSLTAGHGVPKETAYPSCIKGKADKGGLALKVINGGISGSTTAGGLRRVSWYFKHQVDILVIALGANDGLRGIDPSSSKENIRSIILKSFKLNPKVKIILAGMKVPPNMGDEYSDNFSKIYPELAEEYKCELIPFLLENVGGYKERNLPDGIHPNALGHQKVCDNVWEVLYPILK